MGQWQGTIKCHRCTHNGSRQQGFASPEHLAQSPAWVTCLPLTHRGELASRAEICSGQPGQDPSSAAALPSSQPSCLPGGNWLQTRLLFHINEDAFDLGQQQRRITKELFFPGSEEENFKKTNTHTHLGYCRDPFPTKRIFPTVGISSLQRGSPSQGSGSPFTPVGNFQGSGPDWSAPEFQHEARDVLNSHIFIEEVWGPHIPNDDLCLTPLRA